MTWQQRIRLLTVARSVIAADISGNATTPPPDKLTGLEYGGLFVTLRNRGILRGCMGTFTPDPDMIVTLCQTATSAARDPRFSSRPITAAELPHIDIEVSVLSRLQPMADPRNLEIGVHGILVEHPQGRGCFLPHVPVELGWSREEFLNRCCKDKARLAEDAWCDPRTRLLVFTAESFSESEMADPSP